MNVLVLGAGGREHALAWKLAHSRQITQLLCAPGNPGTAGLAENVPVDPLDPVAVVSVARARAVDLVVVGPEAPLVAGVTDALEAADIGVFGPSAAAARIEGSKAFAKDVMSKAGIPTAPYRVFERHEEAAAYARGLSGGAVIKADGLAAGKGVVVIQDGAEAAGAVAELSMLGAAAKTLLVEERLEGEEVSVIALCDGERYALLPPARDHKRALDGDRGPNTGGMGVYAPSPSLDAAALERVGREVMAPALAEMRRRGAPFKGALYAGLMLTPGGGYQVLEFNCRFGDPETQVLMLQVEEDLAPLLLACARGALESRPIALHPGVAVGVVMAAEGYPR
ncbi:MAG TPA: phosphoribosylamine--glycine ligase, partial [Myxococcaceae bacterium]|nr:phosphoribosylamine--glycine ligase [Myxococcaceae bacterium]